MRVGAGGGGFYKIFFLRSSSFQKLKRIEDICGKIW